MDMDDCTVVQAFLVILQLGQMHVFDRLLENKSFFFLVIFFFKIKSGTVIALNVAMHAGTVLPWALWKPAEHDMALHGLLV